MTCSANTSNGILLRCDSLRYAYRDVTASSESSWSLKLSLAIPWEGPALFLGVALFDTGWLEPLQNHTEFLFAPTWLLFTCNDGIVSVGPSHQRKLV